VIQPVVRKVAPACAECKGTDGLIGRAPRYVCVACVRECLALPKDVETPKVPEWLRRLRSHDDDAREGWR
jgi:hypothetical protein